MGQVAQSVDDVTIGQRLGLTRRSHWNVSALTLVAGGALYWIIVELSGGSGQAVVSRRHVFVNNVPENYT
jgi:hypothetical protein